MGTLLRGGHVTEDVRLDRVPQFDPRSRQYAIFEDPRFQDVLRSRTWPLYVRLNQRREGACGGFSRGHDLAAYPRPARGVTDELAREIYHLSRAKFDEWPGENYEGTSVLGCVKAARELGYVGEFRWGFGIDDTLKAISHVGPVVLGTGWPETAFDPAPDGLLDFSGTDAGGHAYLARSVLLPRHGRVSIVRRWPGHPTVRVSIKTDEPLVGVPNSWGLEWGVYGEGFIKASELEAKLEDGGEACITTAPFRRNV